MKTQKRHPNTGSSLIGWRAQNYHFKREKTRLPAPWLPFVVDGLTVRYDHRGAIGARSGRVVREWKVSGKELA